MSELDKWFPRPEQPEAEEKPQPEQGVIEGIKRERKKRYGRRRYTRINKRDTTDSGHTPQKGE